jgi:hypothetical protein
MYYPKIGDVKKMLLNRRTRKMESKQKYQVSVYVRDVEKVSFVIESDDLEDDMETIIARAVHEGNYTDNMSASNTDEAEHAWDTVERDEDNAGFAAYYGIDDECMIRVRKTQ